MTGLMLASLCGSALLGIIGAWGVRQDRKRREARAFGRWIEAGGLARSSEAFARLGVAFRAVTPSVQQAAAAIERFGKALQGTGERGPR